MDDPNADSVPEDIAAQKYMQEALHLTQFCVDHASVGIVRIGPDAQILNVNNKLCQLVGYTPEELYTMRIVDIAPHLPPNRWNRHDQDVGSGEPDTFETSYRHKDGSLVPVEITNTYLEFQGNEFTIAFVHDISDRKKAEDAQAQLEQQLLQFQKMESIGRLAGGVAHDFNNLITVIQGYCDLMEHALDQGISPLEDIGQIRLASQRAAALTRQLLIFSRKPISSPSVLALNDLVAHIRTMLERLIGEDIILRTTFEPNLRPVIADAGQLEQVIMNLAVNARDAMPAGGTLMIETSNIDLDASYAATHPEAPVGSCVLLTVTDTGSGIDESTQARIFEPFFTTKEPGKGTGLGLATVYGIVKQSGGDITVSSQPDRGTTFQILWPASTGLASAPADSPAHAPVAKGSETILLVEDDVLVRDLVRTVLRNGGYTVLEARQGHEALTIAHQHPGSIDLLVTDVVMPQMSGRKLAEQLGQVRQQIKVLFMSGYTDDAVIRHGPLAREAFLAKPFSPAKLAAKVREVLDHANVVELKPAQRYYDEARGALIRTLDISHSAANTRGFAQVMLAQGNVLVVLGDLGAAADYFMRSYTIFRALGDQRKDRARVW